MRISTSFTLNAQNNLRRTSETIARSLQRLSTGKRIVSPRDDLGSFNMSTQLTAQVRGLRQGIQNANTALGMVQTAEEAISSQIDIVTRMRELALSASNGNMTSAERDNLNTEVTTLFNEYKRITTDTQFNGTALLDGSYITKGVQLGSNPTDQMLLGMQSTQAVSTFQKTIGAATFNAKTDLSGVSAAADVVLADINNDGMQDIVATDDTENTVSVMLGLGNGQFHSRITTTVGTNATAIAVGDINNDGKIDVVTADTGTTTASILLGNGDGTFQARTTVTVGATPSDIQLGDFNNDGNLDLITSNSGTTTASIALGDGNGGFAVATNVTVGNAPGRIAIGDFNGDGNLDFVTSDISDSTVSVVTGTGTGTFNARVTYSVGGSPLPIGIGDLDNDGDLDMAVGSNFDPTVSILLNNGLGTFSAGTTVTTGARVGEIKLGDLNDDGYLDLVTFDQDDSTASIFIGKGSATFNARKTIALNDIDARVSADLGDMNGDGILDLVLTDAGFVATALQKTTTATGISDIDVSTQETAQKLLDILDTALSSLQSKQADLAALHNRLDTVAASNLLLSDSLDEAKSKVEDTDYALEVAELVKQQILQQGQVAVLAQANLQMQAVVKLLGNS